MISARLSALLALTALALAPQAHAMSLSEALQLALKHDPEIRESVALEAAGREAGEQDRATLRPTIGISAGAQQARTESQGVFGSSKDDYPSWSAAVQARQPLFRLDWMARGDRAEARDAVNQAQSAQRRLMILRKVAERYFTVLVDQDGVTQAEAEAAAVRESLKDTRKRYEVELVPGNDLKEAQARDDLAQAQVLSARNTLETARDALSEITGVAEPVLPVLPENLNMPELPRAELEGWIKAAGGHNPDVLLARQNLEIARADTQSRRADVAPTLDLVGRVAHEDTSRFSFGQRLDDARIGLELNVPIYSGGANSSRLREAYAREQAADAALQRTIQQVEREARQRFREVTNSQNLIAAQAQVLVSARSAETAVRNGYDAGTRTISDVLDARSRVVQSARELSVSRAMLLVNLLELRRVTGGLSEKDFAEVDVILGGGSRPTSPVAESKD